MSMTVQLSELLEGIMALPQEQDCAITSLTMDSREVTSGSLFVALKGITHHGLDFAERAQQQGAVAVIAELESADQCPQELEIPCFAVANLRDRLGQIASRFYREPSDSLQLIGITGTDGKTSVSHFAAQALPDCAVMGTMGIGLPGALQKATHTTPDVVSVHRHLAQLKDNGVKCVAMEVSSHALDQGRVDQVGFDVAVLTNLSRDHLDYHRTLEAYAAAKEKLFHWPNLKSLVLNLDDPFGRHLWLERNEASELIGYGIRDDVDYQSVLGQRTHEKSSMALKTALLLARDCRFDADGIHATIEYLKGGVKQTGQLDVAVLGRFNLSNLLATLGAMLALDVPLPQALFLLQRVHTVEGRMQKVAANQSGDVNQPSNHSLKILTVVDYAHTPNALENVLKALRDHMKDQQSRLLCVFGCGGDRDAGKRPLMAAVAELHADLVIVTDDNPRTEDPHAIMRDILGGFRHPEKALVEHDRESAIRLALNKAKQGDAVLIAGKGHEKVQILATGTVPFSDQAVAERILLERAA